MTRYLAALAVLVIGLAACGGGSDGWTDEQKASYIAEVKDENVTQAEAECLADFFSDYWPDYKEMEASFSSLSEEDMEDGMKAAVLADAACGMDSFEEFGELTE